MEKPLRLTSHPTEVASRTLEGVFAESSTLAHQATKDWQSVDPVLAQLSAPATGTTLACGSMGQSCKTIDLLLVGSFRLGR